ncbi:M48 family metallopeptidase [Actinoplanes sp. CA-015351]|uniref:M48 family metallopeptidase n=1 Tax=Actinoplanes sp. CA-015351 TaxID=3239897 RepID=UPI003D984D58
MSNSARSAAAPVAALAGFLLIVAAQLALVLVILWAVLSILPSTVAVRAGVPLSIATFGAFGYATWRALQTRRRLPAGVEVTRDRAPKLWELVDGAAKAASVASPDRLIVVAEATVTVGERTRLLGIVGGPRDLYLGLPLLQAWEPALLRAGVAHELAHFSPRLSRWAPVAYRGRVAVGRVVPRIHRRNPAGVALRAYAGFYRRIDAPFSRAQEFAADRIAAEHAGAEAVVAVLRDLPALAGMQRLFHAEYVAPGWQAGLVPDDVFGGLLRVLAARSAEMAQLRGQEPEPAGPSDNHPPVAERIAEMEKLKPATATTPEPESDTASTAPESTEAPGSISKTTSEEPLAAEPDPELVPDLPRLGRALQDVAYPAGGRTVVSWDEFLSLARTAEMEREAEAALATVSRAAGSEVTGPAQVLELAADGRLRAAAQVLFAGNSPEETTERMIDLLGLMLALAALRSGVVRWRHSWTGAAEVVGVDGSYLNLAELARAAAEPGMVQDVREYLEKIGVDLAATAGDGVPARSQILGGLVNLTADGVRTDLLITDLGLLLVPGLPRGRGHEAKRRLTKFAADGVSAGGVTTRATNPLNPVGERFLSYADVTGVTTLPGRRKGWTIDLRDNTTVNFRQALDADELPGGWKAWDDAVTFLTGTRPVIPDQRSSIETSTEPSEPDLRTQGQTVSSPTDEQPLRHFGSQ